MNRFHHVSPQVEYRTMVFVRDGEDLARQGFFQGIKDGWCLSSYYTYLLAMFIYVISTKNPQNCLNHKSWFYWLSWPKTKKTLWTFTFAPRYNYAHSLLLRAPTWKHSWKSIMLHPEKGLFKVKGQIVSQPLVDSMGDAFFIDRLKFPPLPYLSE